MAVSSATVRTGRSNEPVLGGDAGVLWRSSCGRSFGEGDEAVLERWAARPAGRAAVGRGRRGGRRRGRAAAPVPSTCDLGTVPADALSRRGGARSVRTSSSASVNRTVAGRRGRRRSPPACRRRPPGPRSMTTMRSHSRSASSTSWVTSTTVVPASRTWRTTSQVWRRATGSRFWVSSSRNTSSGRPTSASATNSRWRSPPDSAPNGRRQRAPSCHSSASSPSRPGRRVQRGEQLQRLADPHAARAGRRPGAGRRSAGAAGRRPRRVEAEHPDPAAVGPAQALEDLDRRRLAGAVRAEQAEQLPALDGERDAAHDLGRRRSAWRGRGPRRRRAGSCERPARRRIVRRRRCR